MKILKCTKQQSTRGFNLATKCHERTKTVNRIKIPAIYQKKKPVAARSNTTANVKHPGQKELPVVSKTTQINGWFTRTPTVDRSSRSRPILKDILLISGRDKKNQIY
jgi:hypothetical protein